MEQVTPDVQVLIDIVNTKMPFGKHEGVLICDLPAYYLEWFKAKGFPPGKLGMLLSTTYEIKTNGLNALLVQIKKAYQTPKR